MWRENPNQCHTMCLDVNMAMCLDVKMAMCLDVNMAMCLDVNMASLLWATFSVNGIARNAIHK